MPYRIDAQGWAVGARWLPSPHFNERPAGIVPDLVVLHYISLPPGEFGARTVEQFFLGTLDTSADPRLATLKDVRVSSHFFITREGVVDQFVSVFKRAWHAGVSTFAGRSNCNDFSVGIEMEGTGEVPFAPAQYASLFDLLMGLQDWCHFSFVTGHSDIAPGRKQDPGPFFDWVYLASMRSRFGSPQICHTKCPQ